MMKAAITKQQFIEKIGSKKRKSLEQRLGIDLDSEITIEEIHDLLESNTELLLNELKGMYPDNSEE